MNQCVFAGLFAGSWVVFMAWLLWRAASVATETEELIEKCKDEEARAIQKCKEETQNDK